MNKFLTNTKIALVSLLLTPGFAFAQGVAGKCKVSFKNLTEILSLPVCLINTYVVPLLITFAFLMFLIGVFNFIRNADNEEQRKKMRDFIMWSLIALFVITSVWAILYVIGNTLRLGQ